MDNNNIVFEFTEEMGGSFGMRKRMIYSLEDEASTSTRKVLAVKVSEHEALSLISRTPEICWIMGAVEESCDSTGKVSVAHLNINLSTAVYGVILNREFRSTHGLRMENADPYIEFHEYRAVGNTGKAKVIAAVLESSTNGYVNLDTLISNLEQVLIELS